MLKSLLEWFSPLAKSQRQLKLALAVFEAAKAKLIDASETVNAGIQESVTREIDLNLQLAQEAKLQGELTDQNNLILKQLSKIESFLA